MRIGVGTKNPAKVEAVQEMIKEYEHLAQAEVVSLDVPTGVADQPKSLEETIDGAMNRAKAASEGNDIGIGVESGLMSVPKSKSGFMDVCVCAIYDKNEFHLGLSSAWEFPDPKIMEYIVKDGMDMSEAINHAGLTNNPKIGAAEGAIGILTKGKITRKEYTKQALRMALVHLEMFE